MDLCNNEKLNVLHFQHNIYDFGNGYCEILDKDEFYQNLKQYMKRLFDLGHKEVILKILDTLGLCIVEQDNHRLRFKALAVVSYFSSLLGEKKDNEFFKKVISILTLWFSKEQGCYAGYEKIFSQIKVIIRKMFSLRLWSQVESLLMVSRDIASGSLAKEILFKRHVSKLHSDVADPTTIKSLVESFLISKDTKQNITCNVLKALAPYSSGSMIHCLFKCGNREKRLKLLDMILIERDGVLPIIVDKLRDKQPWYIVRNSLILLGNLKDPDLYLFARPFLCHPDSRIQREVLTCIATLGGDSVQQRLIGSISLVNDDVKEHLVDCLMPLADSASEIFINDILKKNISVPSAVREKLIITICSTAQALLSSETLTVLRDMVIDSEYVSIGIDPALDAARELLENVRDVDNIS